MLAFYPILLCSVLLRLKLIWCFETASPSVSIIPVVYFKYDCNSYLLNRQKTNTVIVLKEEEYEAHSCLNHSSVLLVVLYLTSAVCSQTSRESSPQMQCMGKLWLNGGRVPSLKPACNGGRREGRQRVMTLHLS